MNWVIIGKAVSIALSVGVVLNMLAENYPLAQILLRIMILNELMDIRRQGEK